MIRCPTKLPCPVDPLVPLNFKALLTRLDPPNFKALLIRCPTKIQSYVGQRGERIEIVLVALPLPMLRYLLRCAASL
jgi:hypothetical protein